MMTKSGLAASHGGPRHHVILAIDILEIHRLRLQSKLLAFQQPEMESFSR